MKNALPLFAAMAHGWGFDMYSPMDAEHNCNGDTSTYRKARKERARMLSMARQEELKNNPKPPKKRGRKKK